MSKSAVKKIENKVERDIKKNWKKIILITAASVIIISFILFITGTRIRLALYDNLIIRLSPSDKSFTIPNDQNQNITFEVSIEDSAFCVANCSYIFYGRSDEKTLDNGTLALRDKDSFSRTYQLAPYRRGSGQKIYNFDIQCSNIKSFICATKSPISRKSSFITLNYKLTEEEAGIKSGLKPVITKSFLLINNASKNLQFLSYILNKSESLIEFDNLYGDYSTLLKSEENILKNAEKIFKLWSDEEYTQLDSLYGKSLINNSNQLYEKSANLLNEINTSIQKQNDLFSLYNALKNFTIALLKYNEQYIYNSPLKENITQQFNNIHSYLMSVNVGVSEKKYSMLYPLGEDIENISRLISRFITLLDKNQNDTILKGESLSSFEYSKKCALDYCENVTRDVCYSLNKILSEYANSTYNIPSNISILDAPYYIATNDTVKILGSNESLEYYKNYCGNIMGNLSINKTDIPDLKKLEMDISNISIEYPIKNELTENPPMCCVYGECSPCCTSEECSNNPHLFPVVFIHGHSLLKKTSPEPLLDGFNKIQYQLQEDGYINAGTIYFDFNASDYNRNEWGLSGFPITIKASYYYDYFYSLGGYAYITRNADNLDTYAIRLNDIIELIKYRTGKPKVNIIAHSMGGLVARRYIQIFGEGSVDKLVLIATPNKGIEGDIKKFCRLFGEMRECEDMYADSVFIKKLNSPAYKPKETKFYTISGKGCKTSDKDGDGVVAFESSVLDYASSFIINGTCGDRLKKSLHNDLLDIDKYPKVYEYVKNCLME